MREKSFLSLQRRRRAPLRKSRRAFMIISEGGNDFLTNFKTKGDEGNDCSAEGKLIFVEHYSNVFTFE